MSNHHRANRKTFTGTVVSNKMDKTVIVSVEHTMRHPQLQKVIRRRKKYYAHVELQDIQEGDTVTIMETRPLSKLKRWRVVEKKN